jgi:DNA-binding CsgD family transcriptional regulator/tetratricopeptide (TPR) repeat protein
MPPLAPVSAPTIVGREQELAALQSLLHRGGGVLLLSGEAGIGKSRLVREAVSLATSQGFQVLQGVCFDRDQALPFAPFLDMIRGHAALDPDTTREQLGAMPLFRRFMPELASPPAAEPIALDSEAIRRRAFLEVAALLTELAAGHPLLVIVEDIHWCDETSLELLLHLTRRATAAPLMLLVTFRQDEPSAALGRFLAEIDRGRAAEEIVLRPLTVAEVGQQIREILHLSRPAGGVFVRSLHGLTGGNPFFVEEMLRSLIAAGDVFHSDDGWQRKPLDQLRVPRSVGEAVARRAALLTPVARDLLTLAAVVGERVEFALLQALSGLDDDTLIAAVKELIAAQLLVEMADDLFAFRHALTRQAIYSRLLTRERRLLHARVARAIETGENRDGEEMTAALAYHTFEAGDWERASQLSRAAGDRARALYAPHAAAEHYTRALQAEANLGVIDPTLLHARALAFDALGDFAAARTDYEAALTAAEPAGNRVTALSSLLGLGLLWSSRDYAKALAWLQRAVALARTMDDPAALAQALNRLGNWYANHEEIDEALRCHDEALAIFQQLTDQRGLAETFDLSAMANVLGGDLRATQDAARQAAALFEALDDRHGLAGTVFLTNVPSGIFEIETLVGFSNAKESVEVGERALALAREIDWRSQEAFLLETLGEALGTAGEFGSALARISEGIAIAEELEHWQWIVQGRWSLARLFGLMLAPARERAELERVLTTSRAIHSQLWVNIASAGLASSLVALGEIDAAERLLSEVLAANMPMRTQGQRLLWLARADVALADGKPGEALAIVDRLYAATFNLVSDADVPRLALVKAAALAGIGDAAQAEKLLREAQLTAATLGAIPMSRLLHIALAETLRRQGRDDEAIVEEAAASAIGARLAANTPEGELRDEYMRAAGLVSELTRHRRVDASSSVLTPREREIAARISLGRSNREIASELFVSERTVETHVANILRKLAVPSRAGIAAWVGQQGIASPST